MAEGTSVGTVQLDVEFSERSIAREFENLKNTFSSNDLTAGLKDSLDGFIKELNDFVKKDITDLTHSIKDSMNELSTIKGNTKTTENKFLGMFRKINIFAKDSINKTTNDLRALGKAGVESGDQAAKGIKRLQLELEKTESQIHKVKNNLEILYNAQRHSGEKGYLTDYDEPIERQKVALIELERAAEATRQKIAELESTTDQANKSLRKAEIGAKKASHGIRSVGHQATNSSGKVAGFTAMINKSFKSILRRLFVYNLIMKGMRGVMDHMSAALSTNAQFVSSLQLIRTNLMVAFQPIYEFILPALNALMQAVATVTTYIATAISALFGKTYRQSYKAAKSVNVAKNQMKGFGGAAKKAGKEAKKAGKEAKGALMPFDEINQLSMDKGADAGSPSAGGGGGAGGFEMTMPDMATIDMTGINKFKEIMSKIFEPFQLAWANEGQATIDAMKYALTGIWGLTKEIGKSWLDVWTNGTGQRMLETIYRILQNIFGLIGDIARSFTAAWIEGGRGTAIMQHLHNIIQHILDLLERLTASFRNVWGEVGDTLAKVFLETLRNILGVLDFLGEKLVWVWDHGGQHAFEGFLKLGAKVIEVAGKILNEFVLPFVKWFIKMIAPAIAVVLDWIGYLFDGIVWLLDGFMSFLDGVKKFVNKIVEFFEWLYNVLVGNSIVPDLVNGIIGCFTDMFKKVTETVKGLVDKVVGFFSDLKVATQERISNMVYSVKNKFNEMRTNAVDRANVIRSSVTSQWDSMKSRTASTFSSMASTVGSKMSAMRDKIANSGIGRAWSRIWDGLKMPKLKLPHFNVSGKFSLSPLQVPRFNVDWYDKGGIFTGPQIIGVGEKRPEFVGALDDLREIVRDEIKNAGGDNRSFGSGSSDRPIELTIQIGENKLGRIVIDSINKLQKQEGRILLEL